jgi:hypothetical protein
MSGMAEQVLTAGGVAVMPRKAVQGFSCVATTPCLMAVTFNQKDDIIGADDK